MGGLYLFVLIQVSHGSLLMEHESGFTLGPGLCALQIEVFGIWYVECMKFFFKFIYLNFI